MSADSLVKMANDIGRFFASEPKRADAVAGIANHMQRSWEQRMLRKIVAHARAGGAGLDELPLEAVLSLKLPDAPDAPGAREAQDARAAAASTANAHAAGAAAAKRSAQ